MTDPEQADGAVRRHARGATCVAVPRYVGRALPRPDEAVFDQGLSFDLQTMLDRRQLLKLVGYTGLSVAGLWGLAGCGGSSDDNVAPTNSPSVAGTTAADSSAASCAAIPEETAGPFPGDGSNGPDVLSESGVVRRDITSSFGSLSGTAEGIPTTLTLTITDATKSGAPMAGAAIYLWHCDREGRYSLYSSG